MVSNYKLPFGRGVESGIDWLSENLAPLLDALSNSLQIVIESTISALTFCPPPLFIAVTAIGSFVLRRSYGLSFFVMIAFLIIWNLSYWNATMETLGLVLCSTVTCIIIGVPLGIAAAHRPNLYQVLRPLLDLMQTIPPFVYLIPTLILFGLGVVPGLISTVVFALPATVRLTHLGISSVPEVLMETGKAFGLTRNQILRKIEIPHALPTIQAGITQCIMLSLSMVVIAALVGADGLGKPVVRALNTVDVAKGVEAGLAIVLLAIVLDRVSKPRVSSAAKKVDA
ncbi:MAG TPA: choline ABC transporter permease subunit [Candidatus Hydrogenedentes bacterium]|nr:choline ABC transporter permease subunit [Candidatus Hydrogenedentota bacterium]